MKFNRFVGSAGRVLAACLLLGVTAVSAQNSVSVNVSGASITISKALYGVLMENYGRCIYGGVYVGTSSSVPNINGMRKDVIEGFKECGVGCIEWPGGCFADNYHWADGVDGTKAQRDKSNNGLGTAEFYELCSLTNAIAYPTANIQSGTSAEMNAWLNYIHERPNWWAITKFWKIGNEEWNPCGNMTQSQYQSKFDEWYKAEPAWAKAEAMHVMDGGSGGGWVTADANYAKNNSGPMGISFHRYTVTDWNNMGNSVPASEADYYGHVKLSWGIDGTIKNLNMGTVALCFDEWGAWYAGVNGMGTSFNWSTMRDAVIVGMHLNIFNNRCDKVKMALAAQPVNVIQSLMVTNPSNPAQMRKTPAFWVFKMYKPHQEAKMVPTTVTTGTNQTIPTINASASVNAQNVVHVSIVNTHASVAQAVTVNLTGIPNGVTYPATGLTGEIVTGDKFSSGITSFTATDTARLVPFTNCKLEGTTITTTVPAFSVVMLRVDPNSSGAVAPAANVKSDAFAITAKAGGKIVVKCTAAGNVPVNLSLLSVDGRTVVETSSDMFETGRSSIVWQPKSVGAGMYIMKVQAGAAEKTQQIVLSR
jgi:alpha-N-arabinofuranosidase